MELSILSQTYSEWQWQDPTTKELITPSVNIHPATHHLLHGDIVDTTGTIIKPSPIRLNKQLPCVLDFKGNTHGRIKDKLLYRCIPDDKTVPHLLVPYQPKHIGFDKNKLNKYVLIQFKEWTQGEKHPIGSLLNTFGDVDNLEAFSEYQLYCKNLVYSLNPFTKTTAALKTAPLPVEDICKQYPNLQDRTHLNIFAIDPEGCTDIDDAMGIYIDGTHTIISIYIANVPLIIDYFKLWKHITERCSTIYLPTHKIPMLPAILSDNICSLLQGEERFAFAMDITIPFPLYVEDQKFSPIITFTPVIIKVKHNYVYEEPDLLNNSHYKIIHTHSKELNSVTHYLENIHDSHDVVAYFMIAMNHECAKALQRHNCGIYRSAQIKENTEQNTHTNDLPTHIQNFLINWQYAAGQYCTIETLSPHMLIGQGIDVYTHITSPIRRLVDVVNMTLLQDKLQLLHYNNTTAIDFCQSWTKNIGFINTSMKAIKKVQNSCMLLAAYIKNTQENADTVIVNGYLFDREKQPDGMYKYSVYVPEYKMVTTIKSNEEIENYTNKTFSLHLFMDEANLKQKLRLHLRAGV
jgi:exoribonuclease R